MWGQYLKFSLDLAFHQIAVAMETQFSGSLSLMQQIQNGSCNQAGEHLECIISEYLL